MTPILLRSATIHLVGLMLFLSACGEDGDGNDDTIWTGLSGLVIVLLLGYFLWRWAARNRG